MRGSVSDRGGEVNPEGAIEAVGGAPSARGGTSRVSGDRRSVDVLVLCLVLLVGLLISYQQVRVMGESRLPKLDEAAHGLRGVLLADELRAGRLLGFVKTVSALSPRPPFFSLAEAPVFLLFGCEYAVGRLFMIVLFFFTLLAAYGVGRELHRTWGPFIGAVATGLVAASPVFLFHGMNMMLEIPSALLALLVSLFYLRYLRTGRPRPTRRRWSIRCTRSVMSSVSWFFPGRTVDRMRAISGTTAGSRRPERLSVVMRGSSGRGRRRSPAPAI